MSFTLLLATNIISTATVSVIAPFFPPLAEEKGISTEMIGLILSINPIGAVLTSIILAKYLNKNNKIWIMVGGLIVQAIGLLIFVFIQMIQSNSMILLVAIIGRFLQGLGLSGFAVPAYSIIPLLYRDQVELKVSQMEISTGIGYIVGPFIGGMLYQFLGYSGPFISFAVFQLVACPIIYKFLRQEITRQKYESKEQEQLLGEDPLAKLEQSTIKNILKNSTIVLTVLMVMLSTFSYMYFEPIQAQFLITEYNVKEEYTGYIMTVISVTYIIGSFLLGYIKFGKIQLILSGITIVAITFFFEGPDYTYTHLDHDFTVIIASQAFLGIGCSMIFIPALPLLNELLIVHFPKDQDKAGDLASVLFNGSCSFGEFIGPLFGGFMTEYYGYIKGCSYTGFLLLIFAGLYGSLLCKKKIKRGKHLKLDLNNISHPRSPKLGPSLSPKIIRKNSLVDIEIETVLTNE